MLSKLIDVWFAGIDRCFIWTRDKWCRKFCSTRTPISARSGELLNVNDKIDALDNQLVIFLLNILSWSRRFAHKVVWGRHQLYVEIYVWRNKAFSVEHVQMRVTDKLDYGTSRECRGASVQNSIVPTDCGDTHVPAAVLCTSFAQEMGLFSLLAKVEHTLQVWAIQVKLARVAHISTVQLQTNLAKHRVQSQVDWTRCVRIDVRSVGFGNLGEHMQARVVQIQVEVIYTLNSMAIPCWIVANGAYSRLNSFSITFCCIIDPNGSTSLVICIVTSPQMVAI